MKASEEGNNMNCDLKRKKSYSIYFDLSVDDNTHLTIIAVNDV